MTSNLNKYFPYLLPFLLIFSRGVADLTIILVGLLFLYRSYTVIGWGWFREKWLWFALIFSVYCLTYNSTMSIYPDETFAYSLFFIRWPIFAMALSYWILNDKASLRKFLISMTIILIFIIFDTWWQFFFQYDLFGFEIYNHNRLTGPLKGNPHVGLWIAKLSLLPPLFLVFYNQLEFKKFQNYLTYLFFMISTILFLTVFITGERMSMLLILSSIIIFFLGLLLNKTFSLKRIFLLLSLSIFLVIIFAYSFPDVTQRAFFSTINKILNWRASDYGIVWQSAYDVWMKSPIVGVGLHKYREACENLIIYGHSYLNSVSGGVCYHPHNISFLLLSETGIIGFVLFYLMVLTLTITSLKIYFNKQMWLSLAIVFNIIFTCFLPFASGMNFFSNKYGAIIWLMVGVMLATNRLYAKEK